MAIRILGLLQELLSKLENLLLLVRSHFFTKLQNNSPQIANLKMVKMGMEKI